PALKLAALGVCFGCLPWGVCLGTSLALDCGCHGRLGYQVAWVSSRSGTKSLWYKVALVQSRSGPILGPIRHTPHAHRITVQSDSTQISPYVAVNKDALPTSPAQIAGSPNHSPCQNEARFFAESFKRNIRLSFALRSEAAQHSKAIALKQTCVQEPFTRGGL